MKPLFIYLFIFVKQKAVLTWSAFLSFQLLTGCIGSEPQAGPTRRSVQRIRSTKAAAASGSSWQPRSPDECPGRGDLEWGGAQQGLAGLGVHILTRCHFTQHSLLLLIVQPLRHGDDGHAGALPVSDLFILIMHVTPELHWDARKLGLRWLS